MDITIAVSVTADPPIAVDVVDRSPIGPLAKGQTVHRTLKCVDQFKNPIATPPDAAFTLTATPAGAVMVTVQNGDLVVTGLSVPANVSGTIRLVTP